MRSINIDEWKKTNMRKVYNFNAGPAMLPEEVLLKAKAEMLDWHGTGCSIMEIGHRSAEFKSLADKSEADLRKLLQIPEDYSVLFLAGGATVQFAMVPLNLLGDKKTANYVNTGNWSKKAIDEAARYCNVNVCAKTEYENGFAYIPTQADWNIDENAAYLHYTPNETIDGVAFHFIPQTDLPLVADMSSMILSQPVDVRKYGIIYAGAQKNIGQAGLNIVIIRKDLIKEALPFTPTLYKYKVQDENHCFYNTPPTYAWYIAGLVFEWALNQGGVDAIYQKNKVKSDKLYHIIDEYPDFYTCKVRPSARSLMNVMFYLYDESLTPLFLKEAEKIGLVNLRGHRVSGGIRASIYNAMPVEGVEKLAEFMVEFVKTHKKVS